jgi:hypothetical protein
MVEKMAERGIAQPWLEVRSATFRARQVGESPPKWQLEMDVAWPDERMVRTIETTQCHELADAAALILAISIERRREHSQVIDAKRRVPIPRPTSIEPRSQLGVRGGFAATLGQGSLRTQWPIGLEFIYALRLGANQVVSGLRYDTAPFVNRSSHSDPGVSLHWIGMKLGSCLATAPTRRSGLHLCGGCYFGTLIAKGVRVSQSAQRFRAWLPAYAEGQWRGSIGARVAAIAALALEVPLIRHRFHVDGYGPVYVQPALAIMPTLGFSMGLK